MERIRGAAVKRLTKPAAARHTVDVVLVVFCAPVAPFTASGRAVHNDSLSGFVVDFAF